MTDVRVSCPCCHKAFPTDFPNDRFVCPACASRFILVRSGPELGWIFDPEGAYWQAQVIHPITALLVTGPSVQPAGPMTGVARARRVVRQQRKGSRTVPLSVVAAILLALALVTFIRPLVWGAAAASLQPEYNPPALPLSPTLSPTNPPSPTATPEPTHTPTPTSTATPLPPELAAATAWQSHLEGALATSYAIQTQNAEKLAATQTALPPTLTVMAASRNATATQTLLAPTQTAEAREKSGR